MARVLSCGVGARYDTPVGAIRLDAAYRIPGVQTLGSSAGEGTQMVLRELKRHAVGDIVAVDLSRLPGVAVTKVIAPGLRHFSAFRDLRESGQVR